jgi:hypothetical protein
MASTTSSHASPNYLKELPNAILGFFGLRTESELSYETRVKDGDFSVRHYPAHAEIRNEEVGSRKESANRSFDRLLSYIQGENWDDETFSMTTPVIQRPSGVARWSTSFYMKEPIENLPLPKTSAVKLYAQQAEVMAVVRFSGNATEERVHEEITRLVTWMSRKRLVARGEPQVAQFDQPFAIPFLKRNEIHIPLRD